METPQPLLKAIQDKLAVWERPIVTDYELAVLMTAQLVALHMEPSKSIYQAVVKHLGAFSLIAPSKDFKSGMVYHLFGRMKPNPMEVACSVDPFAYVSHLSAMEYHGLTDRFSKILYLTTPPDNEWRAMATSRMERDLGDQIRAFQLAKLPTLKRPVFDRVEGQRVELMRRSSRGVFKTVKQPSIRVAMVGRTFLDMVREPDNCGGIQHVVDTYQERGGRYLSLITEEVDRHGKPVEKVRAGYLLDEVCDLHSSVIDSWTEHAQRGGSRMLDPQGEYAPEHSEKWQLSINVPSLMSGGTEASA